MILISNHAKAIGMPYPQDAVVRINLAWIKTIDEVKEIIKGAAGHKIFCDYPTGRRKPPAPTLSVTEAVNLCKELKDSIHYFAFSNAEDKIVVELIRLAIPQNIQLVPKIETKQGVDNIHSVVKAAKTNLVMLDAEDLYVSCDADPGVFKAYVDKVKTYCKTRKINYLKLGTVVFSFGD